MENLKKTKNSLYSWFWKLFLNNQAVTMLVIFLLCLLTLLVFTKVSYLFEPFFQFVGIVGAPVVFAGILYYLLNPVVNYFEKRGVSRTWSISLIFLLIVTLLVWGIIILIPAAQEQIKSFMDMWPTYWATIQDKGNELLDHPLLKQYAPQIEKVTTDFTDSFGNLVKNLSKNTFEGIGNVIGVMTTVFLTVATGPIILFYLLKDGHNMGAYIKKFLPTNAKEPVMNVLSDMNKQVSQYIRGQLTVAFIVGLMFVIGFKIIGLEYAVTLGVLAGFLNLVPYLGSFLAMIPAVVLAIVAGPAMILKVIILFSLEQFIEGRFVSPLILGSQLSVHPVTIIFVLLTSGKLFGVVGVILGVPGYAAIKVLITHIFQWYVARSNLYDEQDKKQLTETDL